MAASATYFFDGTVNEGVINLSATNLLVNQYFGIGGEELEQNLLNNITDSSNYIKISEKIPYVISFDIKQNTLGNHISFGCLFLDENDNILNSYNSYDLSTAKYFFQKKSLNSNNRYFKVKGVIYPFGFKHNEIQDAFLNIGFGNQLVMTTTERQKIIPFITIDNLSGVGVIASASLYVKNIKIQPLITLKQRGFINLGNYLASWFKNNSTKSEQEIIKIVKKYFVNYNQYIEFLDTNKNFGINLPEILFYISQIFNNIEGETIYEGDLVGFFDAEKNDFYIDSEGNLIVDNNTLKTFEINQDTGQLQSL